MYEFERRLPDAADGRSRGVRAGSSSPASRTVFRSFALPSLAAALCNAFCQHSTVAPSPARRTGARRRRQRKTAPSEPPVISTISSCTRADVV